MTRRLDIINVGGETPRPEPAMPEACQSGGCGGSDAPPLPSPPSFGEVFVNGSEITPESIAEEIQHHPAPDLETAWIEAARALAIRELLLQEARRLELVPQPETDESGRLETEDDALVRILLEQEIVPESPGEAECLRYYEANSHRFRTPDLFEASHILIEPSGSDKSAWNAAEEETRLIAQELGDDPNAFAAAARELSNCPSAQQDGSLGQVRRGELVPEIQSVLEQLPEGTIGREPVRSKFGWHVLRLQRRIEGNTLPFDLVKDRIADMLEARSWSTSAARYARTLAQDADLQGIQVEASG